MLRTIELDKMIDKKNECFSQRYAMLWVLLALVVTLGAFMLNFYDQHFSPKVSDQGAFGSYVGGVLSIVTIYLLYITYQSQVIMNRKTQFETFLFKMVDNLNVLRKEHENWAELTASIDAFFQGDLSTEKTTMKKDLALRIAKICYSHWPQDVDVDRYFSILCNTLKYIDEEESVRIDRKSEYYAFVSSQINDEIMTIVMLQVVVSNNDDLTNLFDRIGFFENVCIDNVSLKKIRHLYFPTFTRNHDEVQVSDEGFEKYNKYESYTIADIYNEEEQIERVKNS